MFRDLIVSTDGDSIDVVDTATDTEILCSVPYHPEVLRRIVAEVVRLNQTADDFVGENRGLFHDQARTAFQSFSSPDARPKTRYTVYRTLSRASTNDGPSTLPRFLYSFCLDVSTDDEGEALGLLELAHTRALQKNLVSSPLRSGDVVTFETCGTFVLQKDGWQQVTQSKPFPLDPAQISL